MDQNPVQVFDLDYKKLTEWLVGKQKLPRDWHKRLQVIQAKCAEAIKEVPPDVLAECSDTFPLSPNPESNGSCSLKPSSQWEPSGFSNLTPYEDPQDYFRTLWIRDRMGQECTTRTFFGGLTGSAALWDKIVKAYEKQNVYLGEASAALSRAAESDLPFLRQVMARAAQQIADIDKRAADLRRSAVSSVVAFKQECKQLQISCPAIDKPAGAPASTASSSAEEASTISDPSVQLLPSIALNETALELALAREIRNLASKLPVVIQEGLDRIQDPGVAKAMEYYEAFTEAVHGRPAPKEGQGKKEVHLVGGGDQEGEACDGSTSSAPMLPTLAAVLRGDDEFWRLPEPAIATGADIFVKKEQNSVAGDDLNSLMGALAAIGGDDDTSAGASSSNEAQGSLSTLHHVASFSSGAPEGPLTRTQGDGETKARPPAASQELIDWSLDLSVDERSPSSGGSAEPSLGAPLEVNWEFGSVEICEDSVDMGDDAYAAKAGGCDGAVTSSSSTAATGATDSAGIEPDFRSIRDARLMRLTTDAECRAALIDDLQELRAFLAVRTSDPTPLFLRSYSQTFSTSSSSSSPRDTALLIETDSKALSAMLTAVDGCLFLFCGAKLRDLVLLSTSDRYRHRLRTNLLKKGLQESRLLATIEQISHRRRLISSDLAEATRQAKIISDRTRRIKQHLEKKISELFAGQPINIFGDINSLLVN